MRGSDMDKVVVGALMLVYIGFILYCMAGEIFKGVKFSKKEKEMAQYPTAKSTYQEWLEVKERYIHLHGWLSQMYPEAFKEWMAVYDVERSVKDE
jgi:hypothetical protein